MNRIDPYAALRAAFAAGARIQAWHLDESANNSAQGHWDTLSHDREPAFSCPAHLYRVHPDDAGAESTIGSEADISSPAAGRPVRMSANGQKRTLWLPRRAPAQWAARYGEDGSGCGE